MCTKKTPLFPKIGKKIFYEKKPKKRRQNNTKQKSGRHWTHASRSLYTKRILLSFFYIFNIYIYMHWIFILLIIESQSLFATNTNQIRIPVTRHKLQTAMAAAGTSFLPGVSSPLFRREQPWRHGKLNPARTQSLSPRFAMSVDRIPATLVAAEKGNSVEVKREEGGAKEIEKRWEEKEEKQRRSGWKEYLEQAKNLIVGDGGPPRWFSPLECGSRLDNSPLMLFLPGQFHLPFIFN